jgi:hypothetical protein
LTDGVMKMTLEKGSLSPSGSAMFAQVIRYFGPENVRVFRGKWEPAMPSNLDEFDLNLRNGMTYEQAAANTFTGRQCAKYGLTVVNVDTSKLRGEYGSYTNAEPEFSRP